MKSYVEFEYTGIAGVPYQIRIWDGGDYIEGDKGKGWSPIDPDVVPRFAAKVLEHAFLHWDEFTEVEGK